ncbi:hypothetical protein FEM48_Zijuj10G0038600 [Ziziphus jujuba var. spinosa]|uniref:ABC-type xenobiotic transporter n=1 Tax=Ziziphus jujuba var. spinosa TaxID=714518 RepID=A0A978UL47_ZIZJJ|nr:hypothetical protein FEM48_Zijuj10G0038600 [Ziziphus jujuba var. spinosa]
MAEIPDYFPQASVVDVSSFPLSLLLCFFNLCGCTKNDSDLQVQEPLLQNENNESQVFTGAGIWSRISFQWLNELFETGRVQKLEFSHVPSVPVSERADNAANVLEQSLWHQKIEDASLTSAILHATWKSMAINAVFAGINTAASYTGPFLITNLVNYLLEKSEGTSFEYGFLLAFIIFFSKTLESVTQRQWYFGAHRIGLRVQAALTVLIYKMSISMKYSGPNSGKIINLINVDVERIGDCCLHIHGVWLLPLQVFLAFAILYGNLGVAPAFATLLTTVLVVVCNVPLVKMQKSFESNIMEAKDSRIKKTSEILKSMRVLKLHGWEQRFLMKLLQLRETERDWLKRYLYTCSAVAFLFWTSPTLVSVVTFGVCILVKTPLTAGTVLSTLATLRILQEAIYNLPELISIIARTKVSLYRVCEFFKEDRRNKPIHCHTSKASSNIGIKIEKGEYTWETSDRNLNKPVLKIMEKLSVVQGYKVAICGSVGSGKSSLLYSILGEIPRISGTRIKVYGTKAIVPQISWIQTGTVRDNVLFGKNMDGAFYDHVLKACALDQDIKMWANGDLSLIGERGINLSGGQKQRIQLARAVYSDSDVYFLDDPFSAVIKDGLIAQSGKSEDLIKNPKGELVCQLAAYKKSINQLKTSQKENPCDNSAPHAEDGIEELKEQQREPLSNGKLPEKTQEEEEEAETGRVKWGVYSTFLTSAYGGAFIPIILLCHVFFQGLQMASNYWLAWATEKQGRVSSNQQLIGIFILLSFGSSAFILGRAVFLSTIALETGKNLFHGMTTAIFRAPISFFDLTPSSRILSRCSTDQSTIDTNIPYRVAGLVFAIIQLFFVIALMSHVAWEIFLLFLLVIGISLWYQAYYITTARELARMVGIRKAPILHHFSESITGATTIRCFNQEDRFLMKLLSLIDDYSRVAFHNAATMEWLSVRTNFLFNLVFFLVLIILVSLPPSTIDPSLAGLAATYGLNLNVLNKCRLAEIIRQDIRLLDEPGNIVEYDAPARLLEDSSSSFSKLVAEFSSRSSRRTRGTS